MINRRSVERILVIRLRYLGDVVLLDPVHRALRARFAEAEIFSLVPSGAVGLVERSSHRVRPLAWDAAHPLRSLRGVLGRRYDVVIDLTGSDRSAFISLLTGAGTRIAYSSRREAWWCWKKFCYTSRLLHEKVKPHIIVQHLTLLEKLLQVPPQGTDIVVNLHTEEREWAESFLSGMDCGRPLVFVHITSRDMQKSLPARTVAEALRELIAAGARVVYSIGPSEPEKKFAREVMGVLGEPGRGVFLAVEPPDWWRLCALISKADVFWGADSAPMHVAAAFRKPLLVFFGPSDARHWRPLNAEAEVCVLPCRCLNSKKFCPPGVAGQCLAEVSTDEIVGRLMRLLAEAARRWSL